MALFRKRETYNEQMLREAGLNRVVFNLPKPDTSPPASDAPPAMFHGFIRDLTATGAHALDWDVAATAHAPGVAGDEVDFKTLPNGDVIVEEEQGDGDLSPLADAIEKHLSSPYHAHAGRQQGDLWGVCAKKIEVAQVTFPNAEVLELSQNDGVSELRADGERSDAAVPIELQRLGERVGRDFYVEAQRIDGDFWEVQVSPL